VHTRLSVVIATALALGSTSAVLAESNGDGGAFDAGGFHGSGLGGGGSRARRQEREYDTRRSPLRLAVIVKSSRHILVFGGSNGSKP
jgi:hypothetical protein